LFNELKISRKVILITRDFSFVPSTENFIKIYSNLIRENIWRKIGDIYFVFEKDWLVFRKWPFKIKAKWIYWTFFCHFFPSLMIDDEIFIFLVRKRARQFRIKIKLKSSTTKYSTETVKAKKKEEICQKQRYYNGKKYATKYEPHKVNNWHLFRHVLYHGMEASGPEAISGSELFGKKHFKSSFFRIINIRYKTTQWGRCGIFPQWTRAFIAIFFCDSKTQYFN
jgi:hypothetical protein